MALNGFDKPHSYVEKHARKLLAILADKWNDAEKYRCLKSLGSSAIILTPVAAIQLRLKIWDPILVLNSNIRVVIEILRSSNNSPKGFIKFWDALLEISEEERLEVARSQTFFHVTQTSHYQRVLQNGVLRRLVLEACSQFQQKLPQFIQRSMLPKIVDTTVAALNKGRMLLSSAVDVLSRVEYSKNQKTIVNALSAPTPTTRALRTRLAAAWGQATTTAETDHPIKSCCDSTGFFHRSAEHVNLRSKAEIDKFLQEVIAKAQSVTIHYRCHNDPRYNPNDVSMMSCKAPNVDRIYHFFTLGESKPEKSSSLKDVFNTLAKKPIISLNEAKIVRMFENIVGVKPSNMRCVSHDRSGGSCITNRATTAVTNKEHCPAYALDRYRCYNHISQESLDHIAADLYVVEKYFESRQ